MDAYRIGFKFFLDNPQSIERERFVPMFHLWIRDQGLSDHLLIDVADYLHVANGPGVVLVSHEANISMDETDGRLGLLYQRKRSFGKSFEERVRIALFSTLEACLKLEHDPALGGNVRFKTDEFAMRIEDRLAAPNTAATLGQVKPILESLVKKLYDVSSVQLERNADESEAFGVTVMTGRSRPIAELEDRTGLAALAQ